MLRFPVACIALQRRKNNFKMSFHGGKSPLGNRKGDVCGWKSSSAVAAGGAPATKGALRASSTNAGGGRGLEQGVQALLATETPFLCVCVCCREQHCELEPVGCVWVIPVSMGCHSMVIPGSREDTGCSELSDLGWWDPFAVGFPNLSVLCSMV